MKYTIMGFSQKLMVESDLTLTDSSILRFIVDFRHTGNMKMMIVEGKEYVWVNYHYVAENLPIIFSGKKNLSDRSKKKRVADSLDRLDCAGVIEKLLHKDAQGTFVFVRIVGDVYEQYIAGATPTEVKGYLPRGNGATSPEVTKDSSINDSSIKSTLRIYLDVLIINENHQSISGKIVEFFNYRMDKPKAKQYKTEKGVNGLFRDLNGCKSVGLDPAECLEIAMENDWQTPKPEYFNGKIGGKQKLTLMQQAF